MKNTHFNRKKIAELIYEEWCASGGLLYVSDRGTLTLSGEYPKRRPTAMFYDNKEYFTRRDLECDLNENDKPESWNDLLLDVSHLSDWIDFPVYRRTA